MFEDDVTVPAGWYPDPMGLPQLRWWDNHAWTEITTEARPPLVVQTATRLAFADEELPTRRQQRERDEEYATLATDEDEARDAETAAAPLNVTLREIDVPAVLDEDPEADSLHGDPSDEGVAYEGVAYDEVAYDEVAYDEVAYDEVAYDEADEDAVDPGDRDPASASMPTMSTPESASRPADPSVINFDTIDYDSVASDAGDADGYMLRPAFIPTHGSALGSPAVPGPTVERPAGDDGPGDTKYFEALFQPRSAVPPVAGSTTQNRQAQQDSRSGRDQDADFESVRRIQSAPHLPIYTAQVWIIALSPLLLLVLSLLLLLGFGSNLNLWVTPAMWAISYLTVVILAIADGAALQRAGYEHHASWAWALLTAPVYLLARSMSLSKVGPLGFAPVLVWAALGILQAGSVLVVPGLIISALPQVFAIQAEQSIASDASIIGADIAVHCAKALPVIIGQTFTCSATSAKTGPLAVTVSLQRTNGWIDWHVEDWGIYTLSR